MVDFNQGLTLGDAIRRCHALDDLGLYWFEEPTTYNNLEGYAQLARELRTAGCNWARTSTGPRELYRADHDAGGRPRDARHDADRRRVRLAAFGADRGSGRHRGLDAPLPGSLGAPHGGSPRRRIGWSGRTGPTTILQEPFPVVAGQLQIPDRAGIGIEWDEDAVRRFAV